MKRILSASMEYTNRDTIRLHGIKTRFTVMYAAPDAYNGIYAQISEIHPYDSAEYAWARISGLNVEFIRKQRVIDRMTLSSYADFSDLYSDIDDWRDDIFMTVAQGLREINSQVESKVLND